MSEQAIKDRFCAACLLTYGLGHLSGGHFNHGITFGVALRGHLSIVQALLYLLFQSIGSFIGLGFLVAVFGRDPIDAVAPAPVGLRGSMHAFLLEILLSTGLVLAAIGTGTRGRTAALHYSLAIGAGTTAVIAAGAAYGARANPVLALAPSLISRAYRHYSWVYVVGPLIGGINAAVLSTLLFGMSTTGAGYSVKGSADPQRPVDEAAVLTGWDSKLRDGMNFGAQAIPLFEDELLTQQRVGEITGQTRW